MRLQRLSAPICSNRNRRRNQSSASQQHNSASTGSFGGQSQADGQQRQHDAQRGTAVQPQPREQTASREGDTVTNHKTKRDNALFA